MHKTDPPMAIALTGHVILNSFDSDLIAGAGTQTLGGHTSTWT